MFQDELPRGRETVLEDRRLTPAMTRHVLDLLDALGFDPSRVGEVRLMADPFGLVAHVTHVRRPGADRLRV